MLLSSNSSDIKSKAQPFGCASLLAGYMLAFYCGLRPLFTCDEVENFAEPCAYMLRLAKTHSMRLYAQRSFEAVEPRFIATQIYPFFLFCRMYENQTLASSGRYTGSVLSPAFAASLKPSSLPSKYKKCITISQTRSRIHTLFFTHSYVPELFLMLVFFYC